MIRASRERPQTGVTAGSIVFMDAQKPPTGFRSGYKDVGEGSDLTHEGI